MKLETNLRNFLVIPYDCEAAPAMPSLRPWIKPKNGATSAAVLSDEVYFAHIAFGGKTARFAKKISGWGIPFNT